MDACREVFENIWQKQIFCGAAWFCSRMGCVMVLSPCISIYKRSKARPGRRTWHIQIGLIGLLFIQVRFSFPYIRSIQSQSYIPDEKKKNKRFNNFSIDQLSDDLTRQTCHTPSGLPWNFFIFQSFPNAPQSSHL